MATRKRTETSPAEAETIRYSEASNELEQILAEIEDGTVDVDALTEKVERAAALIRICRDKLSGTEMRVTKVVEELATLASAKTPAPEPHTAADDADEAESEGDDGLPF
jgi:exodeoxyribonuclease VII small subunit